MGILRTIGEKLGIVLPNRPTSHDGRGGVQSLPIATTNGKLPFTIELAYNRTKCWVSLLDVREYHDVEYNENPRGGADRDDTPKLHKAVLVIGLETDDYWRTLEFIFGALEDGVLNISPTTYNFTYPHAWDDYSMWNAYVNDLAVKYNEVFYGIDYPDTKLYRPRSTVHTREYEIEEPVKALYKISLGGNNVVLVNPRFDRFGCVMWADFALTEDYELVDSRSLYEHLLAYNKSIYKNFKFKQGMKSSIFDGFFSYLSKVGDKPRFVYHFGEDFVCVNERVVYSDGTIVRDFQKVDAEGKQVAGKTAGYSSFSEAVSNPVAPFNGGPNYKRVYDYIVSLDGRITKDYTAPSTNGVEDLVYLGVVKK